MHHRVSFFAWATIALFLGLAPPAVAQLFKNSPFKRQRETQTQPSQTAGHGAFQPQLRAIPTTDLPRSIETTDGDARKCSTGLEVPTARVQSALVSPNPGLIVTFPIEAVKSIGWGLMRKDKRQSLVESAIQKEALGNQTLIHYLDENRIRSVASEVAEHFKDSISAPKKIDVTKAAYKNFANAMVAHQFSRLELGCTESDLEWLNSVVLADFEKCLLESRKADELDQCAQEADVSAAYNMGFLVTQMKLKETLAEHVDRPQEMQSYSEAAVQHYKSCAEKEIVGNPRGDKVEAVMLCVGSSLVESTRLLANSKVHNTFIDKGMSVAESDKHRSNAFDLSEEDCKLWRSYREQATPGGPANKVLLQYVDDPKSGTERLTQDVYGCLNAISARAGEPAVVKELSSHALLSETIDGLIEGEEPQRRHQLEQQVSRAAIDKAYRPCVDRLRKAAGGNSLIDPEQCREEIEAIASAELVGESVKAKVSEFSEGLDEAGRAKLQSAVHEHKDCVAKRYEQNRRSESPLLSSEEVIACTQRTLQRVVHIGAEERVAQEVRGQIHAAAPDLGLNAEELLPNMHQDIERLSKECVNESLEGVSDIAHLSQATESLEKDCEKLMTNHFAVALTPKVVDRVLEETLKAKLPNKVDLQQVLSSHREDFEKCVDGLDKSSADLQQDINQCVDRYAKGATGQAAIATVRSALSETLSEEERSQLGGAVNVDMLTKQKYEECTKWAASVQGGTQDENEKATAYIVNCANAAGMLAGLEVAKRLGPEVQSNRQAQEISDDNAVSLLLNNSLNVCKRYQSDAEACKGDISALQSAVWENATKGGSSSPEELLLESDFGDKVVKAGIGHALEQTMAATLPVSNLSRGEAVKSEGIQAVTHSEYLERLFSTQEGQKKVAEIKEKLKKDPSYDAANDAELNQDIQKYLMTDLAPGGFVDSVLYSVAGAEYEEKMSQTIKNEQVESKPIRIGKFTFKKPAAIEKAEFWGGIATNQISPESLSYYPWVAQTDGAQKAREYLRVHVLEHQLKHGALPSEEEMKVHREEIEKLLKKAAQQAHKESRDG